MDRTLLAIITGLITGQVVLLVLEAVGGWIWPPFPPSADLGFKELVDRAVEYPAPYYFNAVMAWALGSFFGAWTGASIATRARIAHAMVIGAGMCVAGLWHLIGDPAPFWFWILGLGVLLPFAFGGGRFAEQTKD